MSAHHCGAGKGRLLRAKSASGLADRAVEGARTRGRDIEAEVKNADFMLTELPGIKA